jgi:hypothetical protein
MQIEQDTAALIHEQRARYEASEAFQQERHQGAATIALHGLIIASRMSVRGACCGAASFIDQHGAGYPEVGLLTERVRDDALFWADLASPIELETYAVAAIRALGHSPLTKAQVKRLGAMAWRRMNDDDRAKFRDWQDAQGRFIKGAAV